MDKIRIAIVEDDKDLRQVLKQILSTQEDMVVERVFPSARPFTDEIKTLNIDVVLMDIHMPGKTGIECVEECKPIRPHIQYLISTVFENPDYIFKALCAGATGYMLKNSKPEDLIAAVREIYHGGSPMSASIARLVVGSFASIRPAHKKDPAADLTTREKEIIEMMSQGYIYKEIADKLFLSPDTVRTHIRNIYEKLQVNSKMEAVNKVFNKDNNFPFKG